MAVYTPLSLFGTTVWVRVWVPRNRIMARGIRPYTVYGTVLTPNDDDDDTNNVIISTAATTPPKFSQVAPRRLHLPAPNDTKAFVHGLPVMQVF